MLVITHYQRLLNYIVPDKCARDGRRARSRNPAARSWRWSWKRPGYAEFQSQAA